MGAAVTLLLAAACIRHPERVHQQDLRHAASTLRFGAGSTAGSDEASSLPVFDGEPAGYVSHALAHSPRLEAVYHRWRAEVGQVAVARKLPEPMVTYGYFVRSVETKMGPQRHRVGVSQTFPWPSRLTAGEDAASARARALKQRFESEALAVREQVVVAYWRLWLDRHTTAIRREQVALLRSVAATSRARLVAGATSFADLQRIDLSISRLVDQIDSAVADERVHAAALLAALGLLRSTSLPTRGDLPRLRHPTPSREQLAEMLGETPRLRRFDRLADAADADARVQASQGYPSFRLGLDWIETGRGSATGPDAGKDPVVVQVGLSIPLWQGAYDRKEDAARAMATSRRAEKAALHLDAHAELEQVLSAIYDTARRATLREHTMLPQASAALEALIGAYVIGASGLGDILLAQRDLLDVRVELARAHAGHAVAWARLERLVARSVPGESAATAKAAISDSAKRDTP